MNLISFDFKCLLAAVANKIAAQFLWVPQPVYFAFNPYWHVHALVRKCNNWDTKEINYSQSAFCLNYRQKIKKIYLLNNIILIN